MECGQKAPPAAKFCSGCGNAMSLNTDARVEDEETTHDDATPKNLTLPAGSVTISGEGQGAVTIKGVLESVPDGFEPEKIVRPQSREFKGLNTKELARKLAKLNRSDGSREA
tara:strand:+ start:1599 stop:1934 length:336 start_codon:yes stop_codon:yes gene_type:complete